MPYLTRLTRPLALVDLDGTLCDCREAILERFVELRGPNDNPEDELTAEPPPHILARRRIIMSTPGFWRNLKPIPTGLRLASLLVELEFDTHVFTKGPSDNPSAWAEKFEWCRLHVPELKVIVSEDKSVVHGDVLVEDWPPYISQWRRRCPNGFVIIPAQPWNVDAEAGVLINSIRYDGTNLIEVRTLLESLRKGTLGPDAAE
jgi:5'(3')-deoxyribonucleotidase